MEVHFTDRISDGKLFQNVGSWLVNNVWKKGEV